MAAKYLLHCSCGREIRIEMKQAGETAHCCCGARLEVPTMRDMVQLESVEPTSGVPRSNSVWGRREGWILLGATITVAALGFASYLHLTRPRQRDVNTLTTIETWGLWQELRKGPDRHLNRAEKRYIQALRSTRLRLYAALTVAGIGMLLMAASYSAPNRPARMTMARRLHGVKTATDRMEAGMRTMRGQTTARVRAAGGTRS